MAETKARYVAIANRVQCREWTVRHEWASWMGVPKSDGPFYVLSGLRDYCECADESEAKRVAEQMNHRAERFGELLPNGATVVCP